jgi:hypothetical protein
MSPDEQFEFFDDRIRTLRSNMWSTCFIVSILFIMIAFLAGGSYVYIWLHGHDDIDSEIDKVNQRLDGLNATGIDDLTPEGLCIALEEGVELDCLSDVIGTGANDKDILGYDNTGSQWMPMNPDDICPDSCINGTDGTEGPQGTNGTDGIDGTDGINCWDLNENGVCDLAEEDINSDGACNVTDCVPIVTNGTDGIVGPEGPPGPIVPVCNFTDVDCDLIEDCSLLKYDNTSDTWNATKLAYDDLEGDICPELDVATLDCIGDVNVGSASNGEFLVNNGSAWIPGSVDFDAFVSDVCNESVENFTLDCLDGVEVGGESEGDVLRFDGSNWVDGEVEYDDLGGAPEGTALKGIGGGVHFSSLFDQTEVLVPSVIGTVDFSGGEAYRENNITTDNLNGKVIIPYIGKNPGAYLYEVFYYFSGGAPVVVSFYEYTLADQNSGSAAGTLIGSFTTDPGPAYGIELMFLNATASPSVWIPQTSSSDVYIKAIL